MCTIFKKDFIYLFLERGRKGEREGEKHQCVGASWVAPTWDLACNPGMCSDWESNWWPFSLQALALNPLSYTSQGAMCPILRHCSELPKLCSMIFHCNFEDSTHWTIYYHNLSQKGCSEFLIHLFSIHCHQTSLTITEDPVWDFSPVTILLPDLLVIYWRVCWVSIFSLSYELHRL